MTRLIGARLAVMLATLLFISLVVFSITELLPGDVA